MLKYLRDLLESGSTFTVLSPWDNTPYGVYAVDEVGIVIDAGEHGIIAAPWYRCDGLVVEISDDCRTSLRA